MCVISPNWFKTTSRGGFGGTGSIRIDSAVETRFNQLDPDPWCNANRPLYYDCTILLLIDVYTCTTTSLNNQFNMCLERGKRN